MKLIKKYLSTLLIVILLFTNSAKMVVAIEIPQTPEAPAAPSAPQAPQTPEAPAAPSAPQAPSLEEIQNQTNQDTDNDSDDESENNEESNEQNSQPNTQSSQQPSPTPTQTTTQNPQNNQNTQSGQMGDSQIKTGDATTTGTIVSEANTNGAVTGEMGQAGASIINSGNGALSDNSGSVVLDNNTLGIQNNSAVVNNDMQLATTTGKNETSGNMGNSKITTGDANTTGTVITSVNTNVDGITVSEFNIVDDHQGDIVLDFGQNCISGCGGATAQVENSGNGSYSDNTAAFESTNNSDTFQNNDALLGNNLILSADSGNNVASKNTGGDSSITTGDANVAANVLTFANNNLAGNVVYGIVNVFGDLVGDIIFPEDQFAKLNTSAINSGNGSSSQNNSAVNTQNNNSLFQTNGADITNNLVFDTQTGGNDASANTDGNSEIITGDSSIDANVLNIANSNVEGGNWWLVVVNEAGNWVGKLLGAPAGTNFAGSDGTEFTVDQNGYITAKNSGNGTASANNAQISEANNALTVQNNNAEIVNNLNLSANTGGNKSSDNTGGDSNIHTGDANIVANMVNFVNNNIAGNGKLIVTVVNVFGSWIGDFVTPGQQKEKKDAESHQTIQSSQTPHVGGSQTQDTKEETTDNTTNAAQSNSNGSQTASTKKSAGKKKVLAITTQNSTDSFNETQDDSEVKETQDTARTETEVLTKGVSQSKKQITINLAWLLIILPIAASGFVIRKKIKAILPQK